MKRLLILLGLFLTLLSPAPALAQAHDGHAALAPDQIGSASVSFETSCAPAVRDDVNRAIALLHSFWFPEAIKVFEAVAQKDASCAMAYWGVAMSQWGNPYAGLKSADIIQRGKATTDRARARQVDPRRANEPAPRDVRS